MAVYDRLVVDELAMYMQSQNNKEFWQMMRGDRSIFRAFINSGLTEEEIINFLDCYGPVERKEELNRVFEQVCYELLPLAYNKEWYQLTSWIYGTGYRYPIFDSLCHNRKPLTFAAAQHNIAFAEAYIQGQKRFDYLSFDYEYKCDGVYRTGLEEIVIFDDVDIMRLCLENGASPNAFGFCGDRLLDMVTSDAMRELLCSYGAVNATDRERVFVRAVNEIRHECLKEETIDALFSKEPLMEVSWCNGTTTESKQYKVNIFYEAARACNSQLLRMLYPYVKGTLDEVQCRGIIRAILGDHYKLPWGKVLGIHPKEIAKALEELYEVGFRYGEIYNLGAVPPIVDVMTWGCEIFSLYNKLYFDVELRAYTALWKICGTPRDHATIHRLFELGEKYPKLDMKDFVIARMRYFDW